MLTKNKNEEEIDIEDRLAAYSVTRVFSWKSTKLADAAVSRVVTLQPVEERRSEPRIDARLAVCVSYPGAEEALDGYTADISMSGMRLLMPGPPEDPHQDVLVSDSVGTSVLWVQVLNFRFVPEDDAYSWHVRVNAADEQWVPLLERARLVESAA